MKKKAFFVIAAIAVLAAIVLIGIHLYKKNTYVTDYVIIKVEGGEASFERLDDKQGSTFDEVLAGLKKGAAVEDAMWLKKIDEQTEKQSKGDMTAKYRIEAYVKKLNRQLVLLAVTHNELFDAEEFETIIKRHGILSERMKKELDKLGITYQTYFYHDTQLAPVEDDFMY